MNNDKRTIEDLLARRPTGLDAGERARIWEGVRAGIGPRGPIASPWAHLARARTSFALMAAIVLLAGGGSAYAANAARPGDPLFGIDRALEHVRLRLATEGRRNELQLKFAEERLEEVESLISERRGKGDGGGGVADIGAGIESAVSYLENVSAGAGSSGQTELEARLDSVIERLNESVDELPDGAKIDFRDDRLRIKFDAGATSTDDRRSERSGKPDKFEIVTDGGEVRIEIKGGDVKVKSKPRRAATTTPGKNDADEERITAEARTSPNGSTVEIVFGGERTVFATGSDSREEIISEILNRFPSMTRAQLETSLIIEADEGWSSDGKPDDDEDGDSGARQGGKAPEAGQDDKKGKSERKGVIKGLLGL